MTDKTNSKQKSSMGKWIFIIIVILLLAFISMIVSGILGIIFGLSSERESYWTRSTKTSTGNVALIKINGIISTESSNDLFSPRTSSSSEIVELLETIKKDNRIKAVMFEINSPGGSGVASDEISQAIKSLNKTTVSYIREIGASGAYWIATSTDHIIANRLSFVGSIGVMGSYIEFSGLMDDFNISYHRFVGGEFKDFGSPFRQPEEQESAMFQAEIDLVHEIFIEEVARNRNMSYEQVKQIAHGMVLTGVQGMEIGLVDELGGKNQAINYLESKLNTSVNIIEFKRRVTLFDMLFSAWSGRSYSIGRGIGDSIIQSSTERKIIV